MWDQMVLDIPNIEELEIAGISKFRKQCWDVTVHLRGIPKTFADYDQFMQEYIRQLTGPEIFDTYSKMGDGQFNVASAFRHMRKYTTGV